jgi:hypothetical protein
MKNRGIILIVTLSLLVCGGLSWTALAQNADPVRVVNTTTNSVPIRDTDNPARQAVQQNIQVTLTGGAKGGNSSVTIPAGKIFVLEFVSFVATVPGGTITFLEIQVFDPFINNPTGTGPVSYELVPPPPNAVGFSVGNQALRLYAQPGTNLAVEFSVTASNPNTPPFVVVSLSGYLVNAQ